MKVLILVENYPDLDGGISLYYVHTRSKYYFEHGIDVTVLNFSTKTKYIIDNIKVIGLDDYIKNKDNYDLLILHAANIKHHYNFLKRYGKRFKKHIFFFHGHEVLMVNKVYSKPYSYMRKRCLIFRNIYDYLKLKIWKSYFKRMNFKSYYIFVSEWMKNEFLKWTKINYDIIKKHSFITYNSVGNVFTDKKYDETVEKEYDFITIRGNIDGSKYCVDIVNELAKNNPKLKFLLIGKGNFFNYNKKAKNLEYLEKNLSHNEIIMQLNKSKCALMPTRTDAQGLMMCEMATFGIPLITSNISVCHEVLDSFDNVLFIDNENLNINLNDIYAKVKKSKIKKNLKYSLNTTGKKEITILERIHNGLV